MKKNEIRVVIDTNIWISSLISNNFNKLISSILDSQVIPIYNDHLLKELILIFTGKKFKNRFTKKQKTGIFKLIEDYGIYIKGSTNLNICADPKDNFLFELAVDSKADYILSGDKQVLDVKKIGKTKVLNYQELLKEVNLK